MQINHCDCNSIKEIQRPKEQYWELEAITQILALKKAAGLADQQNTKVPYSKQGLKMVGKRLQALFLPFMPSKQMESKIKDWFTEHLSAGALLI